MHDVIEYRSNVCVCVCAREQGRGRRRKKSLLLNVYARGITIRQARRTFDITNVHIHEKQLSFVFIFSLYLTVSIIYLFGNHETYTIIRVNRRAMSFLQSILFPVFPVSINVQYILNESNAHTRICFRYRPSTI